MKSSRVKSWATSILLVSLPIIFSPLIFINLEQYDLMPAASRCAYVVLLMASYWLLELLPLPVTALLPVVLVPALGILPTSAVSVAYFKEVNMLMLGGILVAMAIEEVSLHRRMAIKVMLTVGTGKRRLLLGFMLTTMFLSMWLSSIAVTVMMLPIAMVVLSELEEEEEQESPGSSSSSGFKKALLLSIAYAANIGGTGTMTGSTPNLALAGLLEASVAELTYTSWFAFASPGMIVNLVLAFFWLQAVYLRCLPSHDRGSSTRIRAVLREKYEGLGAVSRREWVVLAAFVGMVLLWFLRKPRFMPGWHDLLDGGVTVGNASPVVLVSILLFAIRADGKPILEWKPVQSKLPWGLLLLLGGGFALAEASTRSGLSSWVGTQLASLGDTLEPWLLGMVVCFLVSFLTEITSNTATANIVLPILIQLADSLNKNKLFFALPGALVCSYAYMLPVATPPNAMVFAAAEGDIKTAEMFAVGFVMNALCVSTTVLAINFWAPIVFSWA